MKNATKKWLIVAGGLAACAALVFIIAGQFEKKPVNDTLPPPSCSSQGGVMVDEPDSSITANAPIAYPVTDIGSSSIKVSHRHHW